MNESMRVYLRCRLGREWYGIDTADVFKVLQMVALTELPNANSEVLGLLTLPDEVIPVIDMRRRLGLPNAPLRLATPIVVVKTPHGAVGLVVDDADNIEAVNDAQLEPVAGDMSPDILGVAKCPDYLLLLLDTDRLGLGARSGIEQAAGEAR
jgi:purine-binding chemotaxis protein CheW